MKHLRHLRTAACACCVFALAACDKETTTTTMISGAPAPARANEYTGDIDPGRVKIKMDLREESPYDAKHTTMLTGKFPSDVNQFNSATRVNLGGQLTDDSGFGASTSSQIIPEKINRKGNRMLTRYRKYTTADGRSSSHHGYPITTIIKLWHNERKGMTGYLICATPKSVGTDRVNWMPYYDLMQSMFGSGKVSDTANGKLTIGLTGFSTKRGAQIAESHAVEGPVGFYAKKGRLQIGEVKVPKK